MRTGSVESCHWLLVDVLYVQTTRFDPGLCDLGIVGDRVAQAVSIIQALHSFAQCHFANGPYELFQVRAIDVLGMIESGCDSRTLVCLIMRLATCRKSGL